MLIPIATARDLESLPQGTPVFYVEGEREQNDSTGELFRLSFNLFVVHHGELKQLQLQCALTALPGHDQMFEYFTEGFTHDHYLNDHCTNDPARAVLNQLGTLLFKCPDWFELVSLHTFQGD